MSSSGFKAFLQACGTLYSLCSILSLRLHSLSSLRVALEGVGWWVAATQDSLLTVALSTILFSPPRAEIVKEQCVRIYMPSEDFLQNLQNLMEPESAGLSACVDYLSLLYTALLQSNSDGLCTSEGFVSLGIDVICHVTY